jgi:hypothetical protein
MKDPFVEEVRQHRMEHTRKFGGDLMAICADLRVIQKASGYKVVRFAPRKLDRSNDIMKQRRKLPSEGDKMS